jgi:cell division initiation protein
MSQRLTPVDILNQRFGRRVSGYAIPEVDDFVRRVAADLEAALSECAAQKERLLSLQRELTQYREIEGTLRDALVLAQKAADETRTVARQQADLLLHEAQARVRDMDVQAHRRLDETDQHIERLRQERRRLVRDMRARLTAQLAWLDEEMEPAAHASAAEAVPVSGPEATTRIEAPDQPAAIPVAAGDNAETVGASIETAPVETAPVVTATPGTAAQETATLETLGTR